jgi:prepilin-type N-terminal cleavage/methylation domain-containing protein
MKVVERHDAMNRLRHCCAAGFDGSLHRSLLTSHSSRRAFTLIEVILVLTIIALLTAAAVPSVRGYHEEKQAREPIAALAKLAKTTRLKAMQDKRPYQIAFTSKGFSATRYLSPYLQYAQLEEFIRQAELEAEQKAEAGITEELEEEIAAKEHANATGTGANGAVPAMPAPVFKEWMESHTLPEGTTYGIQYWHEAEPTQIDGELVRLWVFQPTGIVSPLTVNLRHGGYIFTASFSALTADILKETSTTE